jgi:hypothetical protein
MTSIISSLFQAMEDVSIPKQNFSSNDLTSYQTHPSENTSGNGMKRPKSEVNLSPYGIFKAVERFNIPPVESQESLVSLASRHSLDSLNDYENPKISASLVFKAMEDLSLGSYGSSTSLSSMAITSTPPARTEEGMMENSMMVSYLQFFFHTLEDFLTQTSDV